MNEKLIVDENTEMFMSEIFRAIKAAADEGQSTQLKVCLGIGPLRTSDPITVVVLAKGIVLEMT